MMRGELGPSRLRTGLFWDADSLAAAVVARVRTAVVAQANAHDALTSRDTLDSTVIGALFRLADAAWENAEGAATLSAAAWDSLSRGVGSIDPASLSATEVAVEEMRAAWQNLVDASAAADALWDRVRTSPESAALAVRDAVDSAMADYLYRLPNEAADSARNALADLVDFEDLGSPAEIALYEAIEWQSGLTKGAAQNAELAAQHAVWKSSSSYAAWEAADSVSVAALNALNAADAVLDYGKSRELTVLAAMAARESLDAVQAAAEAWAAVSTFVRPPES
ncbi:MAG: hypothetical protein OXN18_00845 [Gemmatimonadota bacterium]|nr:hypothetical protein [Gemmatimonadota bacterium]